MGNNYWFETGTPSFLVKLIEEKHYNTINIERIEISENELSAFDVDCIELETLLFQTGYLTVKSVENLFGENIYTLAYPNMEVKQSLSGTILSFLTKSPINSTKNRVQFFKTLRIMNGRNCSRIASLFCKRQIKHL